jgi:hypothetical protein
MTTTLRCRPGDLALVLRSPDWGKIVTCIELIGEDERITFRIGDGKGPVWRIDRECMWADWSHGGLEVPLPFAPDAALMPIRPEPDPLDEERTLDVSDIEGFHQLAASGRLADYLYRIGGTERDENGEAL